MPFFCRTETHSKKAVFMYMDLFTNSFPWQKYTDTVKAIFKSTSEAYFNICR